MIITWEYHSNYYSNLTKTKTKKKYKKYKKQNYVTQRQLESKTHRMISFHFMPLHHSLKGGRCKMFENHWLKTET